MPLGITAENFSPQSFARMENEFISPQLAADVDYFSAATAGGAQASFGIAAATAGTAVPLSQIATVAPLRRARLPTLTITDAAFASALSVTVRITGRRFGRTVRQDITATSTNTTPVTVAGTHVLDEVTSVAITAISNAAASDTCSIGFDGTRVGLRKPIRTVKAVKYVEKLVGGVLTADSSNASATAGAPGVVGSNGTVRAGSALQSATYVKVTDASLDVSALYGSVAIAATDTFIVYYRCGGVFEFEETGKLYG